MTRRFLIGAALLTALAIAALLLVTTRGLIELRGPLSRLASAATGREVVIDGTARLGSAFPLALHVEGLEVGGPAESSWLRAARIGRVELVLAPWPLTRGEARVERVEFADGVVLLEAPAVQVAAATQGGRWRRLVEQASAEGMAVELRRVGAGTGRSRASSGWSCGPGTREAA